ncbi:MAG: TonB-dependent receptor [Rhodospirillaceae bacterium]|nr:TonB-dependent receptor [Rhodospirillaceae bacterium]
MKKSSAALALLVSAFGANEAYAQRAGDNAVTSATDAFGTTVGNETIGLYSTSDVRGFDPVQAGNARLEGLYFDRQADTSNRLVTGSSVRVGISAQSYPFPAPTGIADFRLRMPDDKQVTSVVLTLGPYKHYAGEVDTQIPISEKLSFGGGVNVSSENWPYGATAAVYTVGGMFRWRPNDNIEIVPFGALVRRRDFEGQISVLTAGAFLPPKIKRGVFYGQDWADWSTKQVNYGFVSRANLGDDWTLRAGLFYSVNDRSYQGENLFLNTQADGTTNRFAALTPANMLGSYSGEVRLSRVFTEGDRKHTLHASMRGREKKRIFGGSVTIPLGPGVIGVPDPEPRPAFAYGPRSSSDTSHYTGGFAYEGLWANVGEFSFGVQKSFYKRTTRAPALAPAFSRDKPWLINGTLAAYLSPDLAVYGSYTRGLEESAEAPSSARNRGEGVPASRTSQVDAGVRYAIAPGLRFVAGVFQVKKPYFNIDSTNLYTEVGSLRHRGVELSLTGQPLEGLTVVAGTVLLQARVSGDTVDRGIIGNVPMGRFPRTTRLNVQYGPKAWDGFSVDGQLENLASRYANALNTVRAPSRTIASLGARYRFQALGTSSTLRVQAQNIGDVFAWNVSATGSFEPIERRRFVLSLTTDF